MYQKIGDEWVSAISLMSASKRLQEVMKAFVVANPGSVVEYEKVNVWVYQNYGMGICRKTATESLVKLGVEVVYKLRK